ncbi:MAG: ATP synthase F1 subunit delta [Defluviitaleaceae bacterium]|nr:ATP synthase F1 subunit delta [Defluviitaleaceae bacterium]
MERLAALRYSKALFDTALEQNDLDNYNQAAIALADVLESDELFLPTLRNPSIPRAQKTALVQTALKGRVPDEFLGLIDLVLKRGREDVLVDIFRHFTRLHNEHKSISIAQLTIPENLPAEKINEISAAVSKKLSKTIKIETTIDPSLIAGFRIEVDGFVFDSTTKTQLAEMKKLLLA